MTELDMLLQTTPEALPIALQPQAIRELQDEVMRLRRELEDCQEDLRDHKEERLRLRGGKEIKALTEEVARLTDLLQVRTRERDDYYCAHRLAEEARDEALAKAEQTRLAAYADKTDFGAARSKMRVREADAFTRGVQAGREQVISYLGLQAAVFAVNVEQMQKNIRTMQFPEDK